MVLAFKMAGKQSPFRFYNKQKQIKGKPKGMKNRKKIICICVIRKASTTKTSWIIHWWADSVNIRELASGKCFHITFKKV